MADDPTDVPDLSARDLNDTVKRLKALSSEFSKLKRELEDTGTQTIENYKQAAGEATELGKQLDRVLESRKKILSTLDAEIQALEKEAATSSTIEKRQEAQRKLVEKQLELEKEKARQYSDQADKLVTVFIKIILTQNGQVESYPFTNPRQESQPRNQPDQKNLMLQRQSQDNNQKKLQQKIQLKKFGRVLTSPK
jgi:ABC-type transporter Mla subunit MlaD